MREPRFVYLSGGPFVDPLLWPAPDEGDESPVKVPRGNGYEHFESTKDYVEINGHRIPVYRWSRRTFIAE